MNRLFRVAAGEDNEGRLNSIKSSCKGIFRMILPVAQNGAPEEVEISLEHLVVKIQPFEIISAGL
jgi:hypothetical protein